jgi:hypothetical protein
MTRDEKKGRRSRDDGVRCVPRRQWCSCYRDKRASSGRRSAATHECAENTDIFSYTYGTKPRSAKHDKNLRQATTDWRSRIKSPIVQDSWAVTKMLRSMPQSERPCGPRMRTRADEVGEEDEALTTARGLVITQTGELDKRLSGGTRYNDIGGSLCIMYSILAQSGIMGELWDLPPRYLPGSVKCIHMARWWCAAGLRAFHNKMDGCDITRSNPSS